MKRIMDKEEKEKIDYIYEKKYELFLKIYNYLDTIFNQSTPSIANQILPFLRDTLNGLGIDVNVSKY